MRRDLSVGVGVVNINLIVRNVINYTKVMIGEKNK